MKVLIIDNGTSYLAQLKKLLSNCEAEVVSYLDIPPLRSMEQFDAVILSGGHNFPVIGNESRLEREMSLIKNINKPVFGICYGFELIASVYGAKLEEMQEKEKGILDIEAVGDDIMRNIPNFKVFESHRWVVKEIGEEFVVLAKSKDGIEAIKHKTRPIYGVQFHPEMFLEKTCGDEIFKNFLNLCRVSSLS